MSTSRLRLKYLFDRYYNKTATPQERDELFTIIAAGAGDQELSLLIRQAWDDLKLDAPLFDSDKTNTMLSNILGADASGKNKKTSNNIILWGKIATAAVVLFFVCFGFYLYTRPQKVAQNQAVKAKRPIHDALPGGNKAVLTLANGKTIVLDNAQNGTLAKQGSTLIKKTANGQLIYNIAALTDASTAPPSVNTITTPRGGQYQVVLTDGTKVWLNAASSISFPTRFTGTLRQVEITGEAYFEVAKNPAMPFRVKTNRAEIEVLGTHFNVMAYDDEDVMKTTLLEGAVNIKSKGFNARLIPGQQARINRSGQNSVVSNIDVDDETAWKNGIFQFRDAGVDLILRQAARWYDVDVNYRSEVPAREFTGRISRSVKASELLKMLKYAGINLEIQGKNIVVF